MSQLKRDLGLWSAAAIVVGTVIGSGIFIVPKSMVLNVGSPGMVLFVFLFGGLLSLGGALTWAMGYEAHQIVDKYGHSASHVRALRWLESMGPKACLMSWLPIVGDPLCAVAGWLKFPFWPCVLYMGLGKFARYTMMTASLLYAFPGGFSW